MASTDATLVVLETHSLRSETSSGRQTCLSRSKLPTLFPPISSAEKFFVFLAVTSVVVDDVVLFAKKRGPSLASGFTPPPLLRTSECVSLGMLYNH